MTKPTTCNASVKEVGRFLASYADLLFASGSTCIRLEKNSRRIARAADMEADVMILPHHIQVRVTDSHGNVTTNMTDIKERPNSFLINAELSRLSWAIADGHVTIGHAARQLHRIANTPRVTPWVELLLVALANASFCRLFGGDLCAMAIVFIATAAGYALKQLLMQRKVDFRIVVVCCSFLSAIIASADTIFSLGTTPQVAIGTSVLYLVPGIPFINSFCDMLDRHYICAFGRLMNAVVTTACLSVGLCMAMMVMHIDMF